MTNIDFLFIDAYGKFDCSCSMEKTNFQLVVTQSSAKLECQSCHKVHFYRKVRV